jgi:hypothetical protein
VDIRRWALLISMTALACAVGAATATARPTATKPPAKLQMLPKVGCQGLLTVADFPGTTTEGTVAGGVFGPVEEGGKGTQAFVTTCQYESPEPTAGDTEPQQAVGADALSVDPRIEFESQGRRHNLLLPFPRLPQSTRYELHGIGTRAYFEIDEEGDVAGYLQVRNDVFTVDKEGSGGIKSMLATVAGELCKSCTEAEIPRSGKHH